MSRKKNEFVELMNVTMDEKNRQVVSARELHEKLEVKSKFTDWIKNRIEKYGFEENVDYICISEVSKNLEGSRMVNREQHDYIITINMAKELCIVENNDLGRKFRKYFIGCEEALRVILFREGDKKLQIDAMERLNNMLPPELQKEKMSYIICNQIVNKVTSLYFSFPKSIKKADMSPDMLEVRQEVLDDYLSLYSVFEDASEVKELLYRKYDLED